MEHKFDSDDYRLVPLTTPPPLPTRATPTVAGPRSATAPHSAPNPATGASSQVLGDSMDALLAVAAPRCWSRPPPLLPRTSVHQGPSSNPSWLARSSSPMETLPQLLLAASASLSSHRLLARQLPTNRHFQPPSSNPASRPPRRSARAVGPVTPCSMTRAAPMVELLPEDVATRRRFGMVRYGRAFSRSTGGADQGIQYW